MRARSPWWIVVGAMIAHAIPFGLVVYSFTVFFPSILADFGASQGVTAWIISLATGLMLGASGGAGLLTDRLGPRRVMLAGAALIGTGLALASVASNVAQIVLTYGLIGGFGSSMTFVPAIAAVGRAFERRRGLALGLTAAGTGIGTVVMAPIAAALIEGPGWRPALRILAVVSVAALAVAAALMPRRAAAVPGGQKLRVIWSHPAFRLLALSSVVASFGYWVPFFFIAPYAEDHGISTGSAAAIVALMGVANTAGRIVLGGVADRVGRLRIMQVSMGVMTITVFVWPLATGWAALVVFGVFYALGAGSFIALLPALAGDYFGGERLGGVTGLLFASAALGTLLSAPVSGAIFDASDGYTLGILIAGATLAIGALPMLLLRDPRRRAPAVIAAGAGSR